ncbi:MAG: DNA polymerase III subunit beta [Planctomycetaceae bacterium]|nr:DNA polymerase III subunit beta [Planctomycetaceae bacterium]
MKLRCPRTLLATAFQTVGGVVPTRTPKEILRNVKLVVAGQQATLIGTDQEIGIRFHLPEIESDSSGETLIPMQRMTAILREIQDDVVSLTAEEGTLWIRTSQSEFRLSTEDPAEFPDVEAFSGEDYHTVPGRVLKQLIQRTIFAADTESTRYALGGVRLELTPELITLAATDSRRLAVVKAGCSAHGSVTEEQGEPVVPAKAMTLIERSLGDDERDVAITVRNNDVLVRSGLSTIYSRLVEGRFPRYRDVIPAESRIDIDMVVGPFHSAVRQAMIVTDEESRGVDFAFGSGTLRLSSQAADVGTSKIEMPIGYDGEEIVVTFDPRFIADFLKVLDPASQVTLRLIDANSAAVFRADEDYTYVVMPLSRDGRA